MEAGWAAGAALLAADLVRGWAARRWAAPEGEGSGLLAGLSGPLGAAARASLAVLAAGFAWTAAGSATAATTFSSLAPRAAAGVAAYLAVLFALAAAVDRLAGGRWRWPRRREAAPYAVDLAGWALGTALAAVGLALGWGLAAALLAAVGLIAADAAGGRLLLAAARQRLAGLDRVRRAGQRMIAPSSEIASVVERIRAECANVVDHAWFQLDLLAGDAQSWHAGPDGALRPGAAAPDPGPPVLPGVHKHPPWRVVERTLGSDAGAVARLSLWCDPRRSKGEDLDLLAALAPQMAASLQQALLDREARQDGLTGAAVRRVLERRLLEAYSAACEQGGRLAVILCDLDRFKRINDTYGHAAGDRALAAAGEALAAAKRGDDLLARYGGEEFALLLAATDGATALAVAERMRLRVAAIPFEAGGVRVPLSLSAGVAAFPELHVKTASELLLLADEALYEAKGRGRDRCLLNVGQGRYAAPDGSSFVAAVRPPAPPPRLFA